MASIIEKQGIGGKDSCVIALRKMDAEGNDIFYALTFSSPVDGNIRVSIGEESCSIPSHYLLGVFEWLKSWEYI